MTTLATYTLPQMLSEMDRAIGDEINEVNKRSSTKGHPAINGELLSEEGKLYLYQFSLEASWEPQDDTPIKVVIVGMPEIQATIVTSNGTVITIATEEPLPPESLDKVCLVDDPTQLLERLREALKNNKEGTSSIGSKCFALKPATPIQKTQCVYFGKKFQPDESQEKAIELALQNEATYIIGPPGTGKTYTLAAIAFAHLRAGHSVLIAAHTNIAIDNAIMRLADICRDASTFDRDALKDLSGGRIVRYGVPQLKDRLKNEYKEVYLPSIVEQRSQFLSQQQKTLRSRLDTISTQLNFFSQQQQQKPDIWQQTKAGYTAQMNQSTSMLQTLKGAEEKRVANLKNQLNQTLAKRAGTEQELIKIRQELSYLNGQQVQLQTRRNAEIQNANDFSAKLATAQQMNSIVRLMKGIDSKDIEKKLAEIQYHIWQINQQINTIQNTMSEKHYKLSELEQQIAGYNTAYLVIEKQIPVRENERKKFEQLQITIEQYRQAIENGEAQNQQEQTEMAQKQRTIINEVSKIKEQLAIIEKQLSEIEKNVVAEARVIATTLCKVYMSANLRERQFDVVIMDEVSMAPLPSLYIAASRSNRSVVTIGDPRQLAPICIADENSKVAEQWLGTDLFTHLGISFDGMRNDYSVLLNTQARMHPSISKISNKHVYKGLIQDSRFMDHTKHVGVGPLPGKQLILCDTSDASPVATRPESGSRINMYHALCTIEITRQVLASLPPPEHDLRNGEFRVGLVTPYRKQAQLLQSLIKDVGLTDKVQARTVHKFQGLEAEVIIFDTVESPPIPPRQDFIAGTYGSNAMRLVNVAVTRAKHKLIIVAHANHIKKVLQEKDILRLAVEEAQKGGIIKSRDILSKIVPIFPIAKKVRIRLDNDAYELSHANATSVSGTIQYEPEFLDDRTFFDRFQRDLQAAKEDIIIFSPFLRLGRTKEICPILAEKRKAGVHVKVVASKSQKGDTIDSNAWALLKNAGIELQTLLGLHEKFIFIDKEIVYTGSLNALSHYGTTEFMERVKSPSFSKKLWLFKQFDNLTKANVKLGPDIEIYQAYDLPRLTSACNKCGNDMEPKIGKFGVFYSCTNWRNCGQQGENISEIHLNKVKKLNDIRCTNCKSHTIMHITTLRKNAWLDCSTCGYRRPIVIR